MLNVNARSYAQSKGLVTNKQSHAAAHGVQSPAVCHIPSPRVTASTSQTATCPVCKRAGLCVVNTTGLLRQHGPRGKECAGSHSRPVPGSLQQQATKSSTQLHKSKPAISQTSTASVPATPATPASPAVDAQTQPNTAPSAPLLTDIVKHPAHNPQILKRIPKGARPAVSNLLQKLIQNVLQHPTSAASWSTLFGFSAACLAKPGRGGRSRNLTTSIVKQVRQYETGSCEAVMSSRPRTAQRTKHLKSDDEVIAAIASAKLEDGDVKGAVRLLCSEDKLAAPDSSTFTELQRLHPPAPGDRRSAPSTDIPPLQVSPAAVRASVQSFPNGSAAGPDGLRPQHLKDLLLGAPDDSPLLVAITDLTNFLLEGKTPPTVRGTLFGATLLAISKKSGGVRPIAVGYVWRRLAAKVACSYVKDASAALLAPRQLGFGVPGGAEAAVHAARRYLMHMERGKVLIKTDFRNAFNTVRRDAILEAINKHYPELLPFVTSTIGASTDLQFGGLLLKSDEGAQQGDPLGPLHFCIVFKELVDSLQSEFVLGYLDDLTVGGDVRTVINDFLYLEAAARQLGLELNRSKCEVIGQTDETRTLFAAHGIILKETSLESAILLGSPLSAGQHLDSVLEGKREELKRLTKRLALMPSHDSLYLLRNILTAPRLMYLLRTSPCTGSPELSRYDQVLRDALSTTQNIDLTDDRWIQASLPVKWGGLGIRSVTLLAPSAFLASAASTAELTSSLLPQRVRDIEYSSIAVAAAAWTTMASTPTSTPSLPASTIQRAWDNPCCQVQADKLLDAASDQVDRARLLASRSAGSGDWLETLPIASVGLKMDNATVRIAVGLRLGAPIVHPHQCVCGSMVTADGHHGLSCRHGSGRHARHNLVNELLCRAFISTGTLATREPHGLCTRDGKRPDGVTQVPWKRGRCLAWDATCPDTFARCHLSTSSTGAGSAAVMAEDKKKHKYADIMSGVDFHPFAIETSGVWGESALALVMDIGHRTSAVTHDTRSTMFLRQRISTAVQRGNAFCVLGTLMSQNMDSQHVELTNS